MYQGLLGCSRNRPGMRGQPIAVGADPEPKGGGRYEPKTPGSWLCSRHRGGCRTPSGSCPLPPSPPGGSFPAPLVPLGRPCAGPKMAVAVKMEEAVRDPRSHPQLQAPA